MAWNQIDPAQTPWNGDRATWMSQLPDTLALAVQDLSIPGTHDTAAKENTTTAFSATQQWNIEDQLNNGIRFLDLRVKIGYSNKGLVMYHGNDVIHDPDIPGTLDQYYYKALIGKCVKFLKQNPGEGIIVSVKCEGDTEYNGWSVEDWFRQIANEVAFDNPPGTWTRWWDDRSNVNATLRDLRGKMLLWRRFPRGGKFNLNYNDPFGLDLTPLNDKWDNTHGAGWYTPVGGYAYVQDNYKNTTYGDKFTEWRTAQSLAYDSRWLPGNQDANRQFINFSSIGQGNYPSTYAEVMNAALDDWLSAMESGRDKKGNALGGQRLRSGMGVMPMDFPTLRNIDLLIRANFGWTYRIFETTQGMDYLRSILDGL